jgi:hypothetical protein
VLVCLPETKGVELEDMEERFRDWLATPLSGRICSLRGEPHRPRRDSGLEMAEAL